MAKLSAHGAEIGRVYFTTHAKAYMADGAILKNYGHGWKLYGKVKSGLTPLEAYLAQQKRVDDNESDRPCLKAYRRELRALAGLGKAWKLHAAVELMPDDPDGVWAEACYGPGDQVSADVSEVAELCRLYRAALGEAEELRDPTNAISAA